jgi:hypothetical protein
MSKKFVVNLSGFVIYRVYGCLFSDVLFHAFCFPFTRLIVFNWLINAISLWFCYVMFHLFLLRMLLSVENVRSAVLYLSGSFSLILPAD